MRSKLSIIFLLIMGLAIFSMSCGDDDDDDNGTNPTDPEGIVGQWISAGDDVAPLLDIIFAGSGGVDSVYAEFSADNTYWVRQVNGDGTDSELTGTYTTTESNVTDSGGNTIYSITIQQTAPYTADVSGIYSIDEDANPDRLTYEVVQTSGTSNIAPTPETGFGSTNQGAFGTQNIQMYNRTEW